MHPTLGTPGQLAFHLHVSLPLTTFACPASHIHCFLKASRAQAPIPAAFLTTSITLVSTALTACACTDFPSLYSAVSALRHHLWHLALSQEPRDAVSGRLEGNQGEDVCSGALWARWLMCDGHISGHCKYWLDQSLQEAQLSTAPVWAGRQDGRRQRNCLPTAQCLPLLPETVHFCWEEVTEVVKDTNV
jgi:hypothetical protein